MDAAMLSGLYGQARLPNFVLVLICCRGFCCRDFDSAIIDVAVVVVCFVAVAVTDADKFSCF